MTKFDLGIPPPYSKRPLNKIVVRFDIKNYQSIRNNINSISIIRYRLYV
jgi:hypothetical protein